MHEASGAKPCLLSRYTRHDTRANLQVFQGGATDEQDKHKLTLPIVGLYMELYAARELPHVRSACARAPSLPQGCGHSHINTWQLHPSWV